MNTFVRTNYFSLSKVKSRTYGDSGYSTNCRANLQDLLGNCGWRYESSLGAVPNLCSIVLTCRVRSPLICKPIITRRELVVRNTGALSPHLPPPPRLSRIRHRGQVYQSPSHVGSHCWRPDRWLPDGCTIITCHSQQTWGAEDYGDKERRLRFGQCVRQSTGPTDKQPHRTRVNIGYPTSGVAQCAMREAAQHIRGVSKARQL
jgi:hypothetical protein